MLANEWSLCRSEALLPKNSQGLDFNLLWYISHSIGVYTNEYCVQYHGATAECTLSLKTRVSVTAVSALVSASVTVSVS